MDPEQSKVPGSQGTTPTGNPEDAGTGSCLPRILFQAPQSLNTLLGLPVIALSHCHIVSWSRVYVSFSLWVTLFALQHQSRNLEGCPKCCPPFPQLLFIAWWFPMASRSTEEASVANPSTQHLSHPETVEISGDMADLTPGFSVSSWPIMGR